MNLSGLERKEEEERERERSQKAPSNPRSSSFHPKLFILVYLDMRRVPSLPPFVAPGAERRSCFHDFFPTAESHKGEEGEGRARGKAGTETH